MSAQKVVEVTSINTIQGNKTNLSCFKPQLPTSNANTVFSADQDELIEDKTVSSIKSHFKRMGSELTMDLLLKLKLYAKYWIMILLNFQTKRFMPLVTARIKLSSNVASCLVNINCLHCKRPNHVKNVCCCNQYYWNVTTQTEATHHPRRPRGRQWGRGKV